MKTADRTVAALLAGLAALVVSRWLLLDDALTNNPYTHVLFSDAWVYWFDAKQKAEGAWQQATPFLSAPLYPNLVGLMRSAGLGLTAIFWLQVALGIAATILLFDACRVRFEISTAALAAAIFMLCGDVAFAALRIMPELVQVFLVCLLLRTWWTPLDDKAGPFRVAAVAATTGLLTLAWPPAQLLLPVVVLWAVISCPATGRMRWPRRLAFGALALVASSLVIAPATLHNYRAEGSFVPISANGGINLLQGNNPRAEGLLTPLPGIRTTRENMFADAERVYFQATGARGNWQQIDAYFRQQAAEYITQHPLRTVELGLRKLGWFVASRHYDNLGSRHLERELGLHASAWLAPINLVFLIGLALAGSSLLLVNWRRHLPELSLLLLPVLVCVIFHYSARYRLPVAPMLAMLSALAITRWRQLPLRPVLRWTCAVLPVPTLALAGLSGFTSVESLRADTAIRVAHAYMEWGDLAAMDGDWATAQARYDAAIRTDPSYETPYIRAFQAALAQGEPAAAATVAEATITALPLSTIGYKLLFNVAAQNASPAEGIDALTRGVQASDNAELETALIWNLATAPGLGQAARDEAVRLAQESLATSTATAEIPAQATLAATLAAAGQVDTARETLRTLDRNLADRATLALAAAVQRTLAGRRSLPSAFQAFPLPAPGWENPAEHPMLLAQ